jgi:hypothetical protein
MQSGRVLCFVGAVIGLHHLASAEFILGEPPEAPKNFNYLPRNLTSQMVSGGFSVNTASRESARSFYNAVYRASDNVPMDSTADTATCVPGTNSPNYRDAVLRRINWYRAMAGVPATVMLDATFNAKDQQAAQMMSSNEDLNHYPPATWSCYSADGAEAAGKSNIGLGVAGAECVTGYIHDHGANNNIVGHRRWLLYPQTQLMGTGDVPEQGAYRPANAICVQDGHYGDPRPPTRAPYVAWPPAGYTPAPVVYPRWSFSYPDANFAGATINMLSNGVSVSVIKEAVSDGYGENTLVWVPMGLNANVESTPWPFNGQDTVYTISIGNVGLGAGTTNWTYSVTVFDPLQPGADFFPPVISGPDRPYATTANTYVFNAVTNATSYEWRHSQRNPYSLSDGAEGGAGNFTTQTSGSYSVIATAPVSSGTYSFQLGHPQDAPSPQHMTLNTQIIALTNTSLQFKSRLLYATADEVARVQLSVNDGAWFDIYSQPGASAPGEASWITRAFPLGAYAGAAVRVRFNFDFSFGSFYPGPSSTVGWHLDEISISNAAVGAQWFTNSIASTQFQFTPAAVGDYSLQARALAFPDFPLDWGPIKVVTAIPLITAQSIRVTNSTSTARIDFTVAPSGSAATFKLLQAATPAGPWTTNTTATLRTNTPGSAYYFNVTTSGPGMFYRIKTP